MAILITVFAQTIVIGKAGKNITKENALEHIAGYVSSNDISCRKWQRDPAFAGGVPQWCFSKGFDQFAALGPIITSPKVGHSSLSVLCLKRF